MNFNSDRLSDRVYLFNREIKYPGQDINSERIMIDGRKLEKGFASKHHSPSLPA